MTKLHVFVNKKGEVLATGPAPEPLSQRKGESGPIFAGFAPANPAEDVNAYEIEVDDNVTLSRTNSNVEEFHSRLAGLIRSSKDLKTVNFRQLQVR